MESITVSFVARRGMMFVLSSPSGAGKTTITKRLLELDSSLRLSISVTTRAPRVGETHGKDYHFVNNEEFQSHINNEHFLEYAKVFDNYYGTLKQPVDQAIENGCDMIFDVDWQGAQTLTQYGRQDLVKVFILPPSYNELERRLFNRNQDSKLIVNKRMAKAADEISHWAEYDYIIINQDIDLCVQQVYAILTAERYKRERQLGLTDFVRSLMLKSENEKLNF